MEIFSEAPVIDLAKERYQRRQPQLDDPKSAPGYGGDLVHPSVLEYLREKAFENSGEFGVPIEGGDALRLWGKRMNRIWRGVVTQPSSRIGDVVSMEEITDQRRVAEENEALFRALKAEIEAKRAISPPRGNTRYAEGTNYASAGWEEDWKEGENEHLVSPNKATLFNSLA